MFTDAEVEEEFRDFLLKSAEPDDIKNDIFMYLKRMGAREPYVAYIKRRHRRGSRWRRFRRYKRFAKGLC